MSELDHSYFKKRPSEILLEEAMASVKGINPDLLKEFDDIVDEWNNE